MLEPTERKKGSHRLSRPTPPERSPPPTWLNHCVEVNAVLQIRKTILKRAPESFGDESYVWEGSGLDEGRFGYMFRRGGAVVVTSSSSLRAAGQLASLTLQDI
jgi:hypothetical protein